MHKRTTIVGVVRIALVLGASLVCCLGLLGCAGHRPARTPAELLALRQAHDADYTAQARTLIQHLVATTKTRYDAYAAGRAAAPPTVELLVISGGGDWGAFGAGFSRAGRGSKGRWPCPNSTP
jgi:hypothetical protein